MMNTKALKRLRIYKTLTRVMYGKTAIKLLRSIEGCVSVSIDARSVYSVVAWAETPQGEDFWMSIATLRGKGRTPIKMRLPQ